MTWDSRFHPFQSNFLLKNADVSRTKEFCHTIHTFFESFLGEV